MLFSNIEKMGKNIKLKNDVFWSRQAVGKILWTGNLKIGDTITIPELNEFEVLEFHYQRGHDYGNVIQQCDSNRRHTSPSILYVSDSGTAWYRRTANIYWDANGVVEFRNVLLESNNGISIDKNSANNDSISKIVGYN